ncbi:MAG: hypothetical protein EBU76_12170, partial [Gammaproteobacteria bacterium]|nr:hypothetical protein [Gammaproteobacteria bacterium]
PTYSGRDATAAWRARAAERIEKYRKGDLTVRVVDASGAEVEIGSLQTGPHPVLRGHGCRRHGRRSAERHAGEARGADGERAAQTAGRGEEITPRRRGQLIRIRHEHLPPMNERV